MVRWFGHKALNLTEQLHRDELGTRKKLILLLADVTFYRSGMTLAQAEKVTTPLVLIVLLLYSASRASFWRSSPG
jgi:hypothetical protein